MKESTLIFIKPDGLIIKCLILKTLNKFGLVTKYLGVVLLDELSIRLLYPLLSEEIIQKCIVYMANKKLPVYDVIGENSIEIVKKIKNEFRKSHGNSRTGCIMHSSDTSMEYSKQIEFFQKVVT